MTWFVIKIRHEIFLYSPFNFIPKHTDFVTKKEHVHTITCLITTITSIIGINFPFKQICIAKILYMNLKLKLISKLSFILFNLNNQTSDHTGIYSISKVLR